MADFCYNCIPDLFDIPAEKNDLAGLCKDDEIVPAICEGCGPNWFDHEGKPIYETKENDDELPEPR